MSRTRHHRHQSSRHCGHDYGARYKCNKSYGAAYGVVSRGRAATERRQKGKKLVSDALDII